MVQHVSNINDETTDINDKDPDLKGFNITGHNILLRPLHVSGKTSGGVFLASKTQHDISYLMNVCKVLAVGPTAYTQERFENTGSWCKPGDYVLIPRLGGMKLKFKGIPLTLISCDKVLALIEDPKDVDSHFNISTES